MLIRTAINSFIILALLFALSPDPKTTSASLLDRNTSLQVAVRTLGRISIGSDGTQANSDSLFGTISADGRFVAFD